jgi:hypothetical protein
MRRVVIVGLAVGVGVASVAGRQAVDPAMQRSLLRLGPEPFIALPPTLDHLVDASPAAVVAEIVSFGGLRFEEVEVPHSATRSFRGDAIYRVVIRDVLFNRRAGDTPPLSAGEPIELAQDVARENAEAFLARRLPVVVGDECLLFLWLPPYGSPRWEILRWHTQFRKSKTLPATAQYLGPVGTKAHLLPEWFGPSVTFSRVAGDVEPDWDSLVAEVRSGGARAPRK